jgi:hypothetical protein
MSGPPKAKKKCCRSRPRCGRCPVLLVTEARARERAKSRAALAEEILRAPSQPVPESVAEALLALSRARSRHLSTCRERARSRA